MKNCFRRPTLEKLDPRLCLAFGDVDTSFENTGRFEDSFEIANRPDFVAGAIENPDGSQLVFESIQSGSGYALGFSKIDGAGQPVGDFGVGGKVEWFDRDHAEALVNAFRISNGNLIVRTTHENNSSFVAFDSDGHLDLSFGDQGILRLGGGLRWDAIAHPDGGFLLLERENQESILTRYTNAGAFDLTFGNQGKVRLPVVIQPQLTIDPAGKILLYGSRVQSSTSYSVIVRLLADGSPDETFGEEGVRSIAAPYLQRMYFSPAGNAYFTVSMVDGATHRTYVIEKYTSDMLLDSNFGVAGSTEYQVPKGRYSLDLFVRPTLEGGLLVEQTWIELRGSRMVIARITSDGKLDESFGEMGVVQYPVDENVFSRGLYRDSAGNIYWIGSYQPETNANWKSDGLMVRFTATGDVDATWAAAGRWAMDHTVGAQMIESIELAATYRGSPLIATGWRDYGKGISGTGRVHLTDDTGTRLASTLGSAQLRRPITIGAKDGGWYVIGGTGSNPYAIEVQRFNADASRDSNFGENGILAVQGSYPDHIIARLDESGAVTIVASDYATSADPDAGVGVAVIIRLSPEGRLDSEFADAGMLRLYEKPAAILDVMVSKKFGIVLVYRNTILQAFSNRGTPILEFGTNGVAMPEGITRREWVTGEVDHAGNIFGIVREYYSDFTQGYSLVKLNSQGSVDQSFAGGQTVTLPWEWNTAYDSPEMAIQSGIILLANAHGRHASTVRLLAYDLDGQPIKEFGGSGARDFDFAPNGESVAGLEFAEDGSIWLSLKERRGFDEIGTVYRLIGSAHSQMHNWYDPLDVNRDNLISPLDVLLVINQLNAGGWDRLTRPDINNDDSITPLDSLLIINYLNQHSSSLSDGESDRATQGVDLSWLFDEDELRLRSRLPY